MLLATQFIKFTHDNTFLGHHIVIKMFEVCRFIKSLFSRYHITNGDVLVRLMEFMDNEEECNFLFIESEKHTSQLRQKTVHYEVMISVIYKSGESF